MLSWLEANAGSLLAAIAIIAAWLTFRIQQSKARGGLVDAVKAELQLHSAWVGNPYTVGVWPAKDAWWSLETLMSMDNHVPLVHVLSTVATDSAIAQGPALFINRRLVFALVQYRQRVTQLNQLIENAMAFQAAPELWEATRSDELVQHFALTLAAVHWSGIGNLKTDGAHRHFMVAAHELQAELDVSRVKRWAWFWLGLPW